jgi:hypothetical protein
MFPHERLDSMSDKELQDIWQAILQISHPCCCAHSDTSRDNETEEAYAERTEWEQAVFTTLEMRQLPTKRQHPEPEPLTCSTCHGELETLEGNYGVMYVVCRTCQTHRQLGDHMDCSLGTIMPGLPEMMAI